MSVLLELLQPTVRSVSRQLEQSSSDLHASICVRALVRACANANIELVDWLLTQHGPAIDLTQAVDEDGCPALILAVNNARSDIVRALVEAGCDVNAADASGWTSLHWCASTLDLPTASYLLKHGAVQSRSYKGLRPADLVKHGLDGDALRELLAEHSGSEPLPAKTVEVTRRKLDLAHESARQLHVDVDSLGLTPYISGVKSPLPTSLENEFRWDACLPDEMLVLALEDLPVLFDLVITQIQPTRATLQRTFPASALFLATRFASHYGTPDMLEELIFGAIEKIEDAVHGRPDDVANCAFWLSNAVVLLYYLRTDDHLCKTTQTYQMHLTQLVRELCVFVIRDVERRIDRILDSAMLDYEAVTGFEDVKFVENEWKVLKAFSLRGKKDSASSQQGTPRASVMSLFAHASPDQTSPSKQGKPTITTRPPSPDVESAASPKSITSLLSSALFVLQLYEVHPLTIAQTFSQIFYWLACELSNRVLTRKKYLCRSKAMQIRLNVSAFEDWARLNKMPSKLVTIHFRPFNQLLQWLQCLSSEDTMDGLVGTMQNLNCLNPLQLRRAVRDYRYEVDEGKIGDECVHYLEQLEKDWSRQRVSKSVEQAIDGKAASDGSDSGSEESGVADAPVESKQEADVRVYLDQLVAEGRPLSAYEPARVPECLGEFLDSRFMLPFALPSSAEQLLAFGREPSFGPFAEPSPRDGTLSPPPAPALFTTSVHFVPILPDGFLERFDAVRSRCGHLASPARAAPATGLGFDMTGGTGSLSMEALADFHDWRKRLEEAEVDGDGADLDIPPH